MPNSTQDAVLAEIRNARADLSRLVDLADSILGNVRGLYRRAKPSPSQPPLPGLVADDSPLPEPGEIARSLPRRWCNTVRVYEALWERYGEQAFTHAQLFVPGVGAMVRSATGRELLPQTLSRMMVDVVRAGAAEQVGRGRFRLMEPTDERREAVENAAVKHPATKETAHA
ncbi:MAG: hypothetical protein IJV65_07525 [Kiritimatiellae bacterium]|nr:hypothetical protein [Kiritimatiellia bacterium]